MPKFHVSRSIIINAPQANVFQLLSDFRTWTTWSPWLISEPDAKVTVSDNPNSVGSSYHWTGKIVGEGRLEHRCLVQNSLIEDDLNFIKPFKSYAKVVFKIDNVNEGTQVTWSMDSSLPWFLFWMISMMKTFLGMDYARGLNMFKEWVETDSITSKSSVHGVESVAPFRMAGMAASCPVEQVGPSMEKTFSAAQAEFKRLGIPMDREMISVYTKFRIGKGVFEYISGYIIPAHVQIPTGSSLKTWSLPVSKTFRVEHTGGYQHLGNGWSIANQLVRHKKLKQSRCGTFEIYRTVPPTPDAELITDIYLPLKG